MQGKVEIYTRPRCGETPAGALLRPPHPARQREDEPEPGAGAGSQSWEPGPEPGAGSRELGGVLKGIYLEVGAVSPPRTLGEGGRGDFHTEGAHGALETCPLQLGGVPVSPQRQVWDGQEPDSLLREQCDLWEAP